MDRSKLPGIPGVHKKIILTDQERLDLILALRLVNAYEAQQEKQWGRDVDPIRDRWKKLADELG